MDTNEIDQQILKEAIRIFAVYENAVDRNDFIISVDKVDFSYKLLWSVIGIAFDAGLGKPEDSQMRPAIDSKFH